MVKTIQSKIHKGKVIKKDHKEKLREMRLGVKLTDEIRKKLSEKRNANSPTDLLTNARKKSQFVGQVNMKFSAANFNKLHLNFLNSVCFYVISNMTPE